MRDCFSYSVNDKNAPIYKDIPDDEVCMYDGLVRILTENYKEDRREYIHIVIDGQYNDPLSLADIEKVYPDVRLVFFESALYGDIYKYEPGAAGDGTEHKWWKYGTTRGYA